jgi:hypothetical protein
MLQNDDTCKLTNHNINLFFISENEVFVNMKNIRLRAKFLLYLFRKNYFRNVD